MEVNASNALAQCQSAYLKSAAHQPVHWFAWGEQAFAAARQEDKPILLDVGAVWCHWCHVMDRESYEDAALAEVINRHFVAVKVDRDERPDVDSRYQAAVSALSGQGGWPLTVFLTPQGEPFYGGTYFPPHDGMGRPSFRRVLESVAQAYREQHEKVLETAAKLMQVLQSAEDHTEEGGAAPHSLPDDVLDSAVKMFDFRHGGFGSAPKFPHPAILDLMLDRYAHGNDQTLGSMATATLEKMAQGGVYDQLGGGFHRYSVDERWCVPHFEKMSYDNSELLKNYVHGWQVTGAKLAWDTSIDIVRWVDGWMTDRADGGFFASQDADVSLDDDGDYFTWTRAEAEAVLTGEQFRLVSEYFDIGETGEMHHNHARNVLWIGASLEQVARRIGIPVEGAAELLGDAKRRMYEARCRRPTPYIDQTLYTSWNAMFVSAYLQAATAMAAHAQGQDRVRLNEARRFALRTLDRFLDRMAEGKGITHAPFRGGDGVTDSEGLFPLDDQVFTALACLDAFEATADAGYYAKAVELCEVCLHRYWDERQGGFYDLPREPEEGDSDRRRPGVLSVPRKPLQDSPTPSGNGSALILSQRLYALSHDERLAGISDHLLRVFGKRVSEYGLSAASFAIGAQLRLQPPLQILIIGNDLPHTNELERAARRPFRLGKAVFRFVPGAATEALPQLLQQTLDGFPAHLAPAALVCEGYTCRAPVQDPEQLTRLLHEVI